MVYYIRMVQFLQVAKQVSQMKDDPHAGHKMKKSATSGHEHQGITPDKFGPTLMLMTTFPKAGLYQIFGQLKHSDQILWSSFHG